MSLVVVGLNHRTVPVELLERMSVAPEGMPKALEDLARREHLAEVVLLSTCNRTEVYSHATLFHPAMQDVRDFLADTSGVDPDEFGDLLYAYYDDAAVVHLFGVAAGLDSMIIGEGEILGQVREAWTIAEREHASGPLLSRTFRHAIEVGKSAPGTETGIGRNSVSVSTAAVTLAASKLGTLDERRVLVLGAGGMGESAALALAGAGVGEIVVANRTASTAEALAARVNGRAIPLSGLTDALDECDLLLVSTGAPDVLVERGAIEAAMARRNGRALLIVDIGVPRNVDPGAGEVFGVDLLDIDDLRGVGEQSLAQRRQEVGKVRDVIAEELDKYRIEKSAREAAPLVTALRARAEDIRLGELERARARLGDLTPEAWETLDALTRSVVNKLLHEPTVRIKDAAGTPRGDLYADALADLLPCATSIPTPTLDADAPRCDVRSVLARWQAERVATLLGGEAELVIIATTGDARTDTPIHAMGGTGVFVKEVQQAVLDGQADVAVHSAKDLPASASPDGLVLAAVPERADPRDALVGSTLDALPTGARIGTGSVRRRAQLAALRPDFTFAELRGNIPTRLEKASEFDAIVVALAALDRLGLRDRATEVLDPSVMLPMVAQGAVVVECRGDDAATLAQLAAIDDPSVHELVDAERAFLSALGGGCNLPCAALARHAGTEIAISALLASADGRILLRSTRHGSDPLALGAEAATDLLDHGGRELLDAGVGA